MSDDVAFSQAELLRRIDTGWRDFAAYVATLSEHDMTGPTDAEGWTVKDHLTHIAAWAAGINNLLHGRPRWEAMGVDRDLFLHGEEDDVNAGIRDANRDRALDDVLRDLREGTDRLVATIEAMTTEDLEMPYRHYAPESDRDQPVWGWIAGNTFGHYDLHRPWIEAIVS